MTLKAPFPYFGSKKQVAKTVWAALGSPKHYIEPFFGSGAVLFGRPDYAPGMTETVCDKDGFVSNVWRSIKYSPDETAKWCDWPVNHADLIARRKVLIANEENLLENLCKDDVWHDPKIAGYWIWAASCWIGSGLTRPNAVPHISNGGKGGHGKGKIPHIGNGGQGVHGKGKIPHISAGGKGVHGKGVNGNIYEWMNELAERLRYVRVVCGDWTRVCGGNWQEKMGTCGMFFDPPYADQDRDGKIYHHDSFSVGLDVEKWVLERGANPKYRIVVAGYNSEYKSLVENGWKSLPWKANGGYGNQGQGRGKDNAHREMLWLSPHCLGVTQINETAAPLFEAAE